MKNSLDMHDTLKSSEGLPKRSVRHPKHRRMRRLVFKVFFKCLEVAPAVIKIISAIIDFFKKP